MKKRAILKYAVLPGLWPRIKELFGTGFAHISFCIAQIYAAVRLLPQDHPYLQSSNFGRFGVRHVLAEASNNLVLSRKNIDQILIYGLILMGIILLIGQFVILIAAFINQPALAQAAADSGLMVNPSFSQLFGTPSFGSSDDIVLKIMDRVFGIPNIFNSCISNTTVQCMDMHGEALFTPPSYPFPIHHALHALFAYYSYGMMAISTIIILYFVITIVGETAVTGTPFGQRFNKAWAPIRLIVFFALITPIGSYGLNSGQYLVLHIANLSSNFATNGWVYFNKRLVDENNKAVETMWDPKNLVGKTELPELGSLVEFMYLVKTCEASLNSSTDPLDAYVIKSGILDSDPNIKLSSTNFQTAKDFSGTSDITFVFGHADEEEHALHRGHVKPVCGTMSLPIVDLKEPGSVEIQSNYFDMVKEMYNDMEIKKSAQCLTDTTHRGRNANGCTEYPTTIFMHDIYREYQDKFVSAISLQNAIDKQMTEGDFAGPKGLKELGWGGAAIWYNRIAEMNGAITTSLYNLPRINDFPDLMQQIAQEKSTTVQNVDDVERYNPQIKTTIAKIGTDNYYAAASMYHAHKLWRDSNIASQNQAELTGNAFIDTTNYLMGTGGLFTMLENTDVNPMAQLSAIGKSMMEAAIRGLAVTGGAKVLDIFGVMPKGSANIVTGFVMSLVAVSMLMGFMLFYVLPLMPFVYFLFAVGGWVKSIFEAVVAIPLWAMAHIRIDGEGLPGRDASNGYYLLLEIFLRPILIVVGLIGAILMFSAMALALNEVYDLVIRTAYGNNPIDSAKNYSAMSLKYYTNSIDIFFFTATYTIMIYITGTSCFKMIDLVPKSILRWMGVSVSTFQEDMGDPAATMSGQIYKRANLTISLARQSLSGKSDPGELAALMGGS